MDLLPIQPSNTILIDEYYDNRIVVNQKSYTSSILVTPDSVQSIELKNISDINQTHQKLILELDIELIILGTGNSFKRIENKYLKPIIQANLAYEVMSNLRACGTFNLLRSDNRLVATLLILNNTE